MKTPYYKCRGLLYGGALVLGSAVLALAALETAVRLTEADLRQIWPILYYVEGDCRFEGGDRELVRHSENPERLYELIPGAETSSRNCNHPGEIGKVLRYRINRLGFRGDREYSPEKPPGVYRIIVLGGSNTYGFSVSNGETYPERMQQLLDKRFPGRFEVWNAGINAYVMVQKTAYARELLERYAPDMLIFQDFNNSRRAFFYRDARYREHFRANPELYRENIPLMLSERRALRRLHHALLLRSALYRFVQVRILADRVARTLRRCPPGQQLWTCFGDDIQTRFDIYADGVNSRAFESFFSSSQPAALVHFKPLSKEFCIDDPERRLPGVTHFSFCGESKPPEYSEPHPPSWVYPWYARELVEKVVLPAYRRRT